MPIKSYTMRDPESAANSEMSPMDQWVAGLKEGGGRMNPYNPKHQMDIQNMMNAIVSGQLSEDSVNKLARNNPKVAQLLYSAQAEWKNRSDQRMAMGNYFKDPTPDRQIPEMYQPAGPTESGAAMAAVPTGEMTTIKGQPAFEDPQGAIRYLSRMGRFDEAKKLSEVYHVGGEGSLFNKIDPSKYTPESIRNFMKTKDYSSLVSTEDKVARGDKTFTQEGALRDDFTRLSQPFMDVRDSYSRIKESGKNPSPAGDISLLYNYMKMLDPRSTVREGEFATAANAGSISDKIYGQYNKLVNGERLAPSIRNDFLSRSNALYKRALTTHKKNEDQFRKLAKSYNLDPRRAVPDYTSDEDKPDTAPSNSPGSSIPPGWKVKVK